jgi:cytochrome d ubiquinol oxidase subunit I
VLRTGLTLARAADPAADPGRRPARPEHAAAPAAEGRRDGRHLADQRGAPLLLFACPTTTRSNHFEIGIPKLASLILTHDADGEIRGLNDFPARTRRWRRCSTASASWSGGHADAGGQLGRPVAVPARAAGSPQRLPRWLLWVLAGMSFSGWVATVAGWYVTEIGRQPFMVFGLLRTADVASAVPAPMIALTLALYVTVYLALLVAYVGVLKYMAEKPRHADAENRPRARHALAGWSKEGRVHDLDEALPVVFMG